MAKLDKEFAVGISTIFFAALAAAISMRASLNPVVFVCFGTAFGIIIGIGLTGLMKGPVKEHSIGHEGENYFLKEKKEPKVTVKKRKVYKRKKR